MTTAQRLREAREAASLSVSQIARLIEVDPSYVRLLESGGLTIPMDRARQFSDYYGVDLTWLTCGASELSPAALKAVRGLERLPEEDRAKVVKVLEMMGWAP